MKQFGNRYILLAAICLILSCAERHNGMRIAVPDDLCGILANCLVQSLELMDMENNEVLVPLMDCCSSTAEWALSSDQIDAAWLCPDAAQNLLEKNNRFKIVGPAVINSQILVIRQGRNPERIAYSHKREYQRVLIQRRFGMDCEAIPVMPSALPYIYEHGNVDGAVVDILKGITMKGKHLRLSDDGTDIVTYVLVVSKKFQGSDKFPKFLSALRNTAEQLNNIDILTKVLAAQKKMTVVDVRQIASLSARFIPPHM